LILVFIVLFILRLLPSSTLFPYTTLFRSRVDLVVLAQADGLHATANDGRNLLADHTLGSNGDGLQTGAAETVQRHAGGGHRQAGAYGCQTGHVLALGTFMEGSTEDHVLDQRWVDACALDRFLDHETGHIDTVGVVQCAAVGFAQAGTGRGNDYCISHGSAPVYQAWHPASGAESKG